MSRLLYLFTITIILVTVLDLGFAGIADIILGNKGRCRRRHSDAICKYFCDDNECHRGDCICKSNWSGLGACGSIPKYLRRGCGKTVTDDSCPFICTGKDKKTYCVIWTKESGVCESIETGSDTEEDLDPSP